jgi:hypothetical protein
MTNTTIENQALSIQLNSSESVTVPTGEVWKVTINGRAAVAASDENNNQSVRRYCRINGVVAASSESESRAWTDNFVNENDANSSESASTTFPINAVLVEGDTIEPQNTGLQIGGFVVN